MARPTPVHVEVAGRALRCLVCDADVFTVRTITLITSGLANTGFNKQATWPPAAPAVTCTSSWPGAGHQAGPGLRRRAGRLWTHAPWAASRSPRVSSTPTRPAG